MSKTIIELDADEIDAAMSWHGGQGSMLYAVASTGALALGTVRPSERVDGRSIPLTDLEWKRDLVEKLEGEASSDAEAARERSDAVYGGNDGEYDELLAQASALESIAHKCTEWLAANPEVQS